LSVNGPDKIILNKEVKPIDIINEDGYGDSVGSGYIRTGKGKNHQKRKVSVEYVPRTQPELAKEEKGVAKTE